MNDASAKRLIAIVCAAQALVQIGAFFWPALLPSMMLRWELSNSDAGWITGIFYAAYMVSVPLLVTLTDRVDPRAVYLCDRRDLPQKISKQLSVQIKVRMVLT
ncbi:MAG: hypothetical protein ACO37Z_12815 [Burkholderiaceae bacterium]